MTIQTIPAGALQTNCYLLIDESSRRCAAIDPGGEGERIAAVIDRLGLELARIFLTHGHFDHVEGVPALLRRWPEAEVYLSREDFGQPLPGRSCDQRLYPVWSLIEGGGDWTEVNWYGEGDTLLMDGLTISVLSTPGHTEGSVTLLCGDAMFAGDTLFAGSCGRCDMEGGDVRQMAASLKRLGLLEGDYTVYPGHGDASTLSEERRSNHYMRQAMRL